MKIIIKEDKNYSIELSNENYQDSKFIELTFKKKGKISTCTFVSVDELRSAIDAFHALKFYKNNCECATFKTSHKIREE